jgi:hypothetical protein
MKSATVRALLFAALVVGMVPLASAQDAAQVASARRTGQTRRVTGVVRDLANAISLPGVLSTPANPSYRPNRARSSLLTTVAVPPAEQRE